MKFSESLLKDKDIGKNIFDNSVDKANILLHDVFLLNFDTTDSNIIKVVKNKELRFYSVKFKFKDRELTAELSFKKVEDNTVQDIVTINEVLSYIVQLDASKNFKVTVDHIMTLLEDKYDLEFTPLDPDERDTNIKNIISDSNNKVFDVTFISPNHEAVFKASFNSKSNSLDILGNYQHMIYLD